MVFCCRFLVLLLENNMSNILKEMKHRTNKLKADSNTPTFGLSARTSAWESCSYLSTYQLMKVVGGFMVFCCSFLFCWRFLVFLLLGGENRMPIAIHCRASLNISPLR